MISEGIITCLLEPSVHLVYQTSTRVLQPTTPQYSKKGGAEMKKLCEADSANIKGTNKMKSIMYLPALSSDYPVLKNWWINIFGS
mmetsp:Transcript_1366/g.3803  ORF Transcript_1366/g.3803 Transcript_1366/m.3803 type:complete len:85 (+) Transcript_1366:761-1015(+)